MYIWATNPMPCWPYAPAPNVPSNNRIMPPPSPSVSNTSSNQSNSANSSANGSGSPHSLPACAINQQGPMQAIDGSPNGAGGQQHSNGNYGSEQLSKTNLYIRGLSAATKDEDLHNLCKQYGKIVSTKAIIDPATNLCKGYGFVDFDHKDSASYAVHHLKNKGIQAQMAKQQEQDPTNLYISNLPRNISENELESMLSPYGQVISTRILRDNAGVSKGVGFARMESTEKCEQIIAKFNGKYLHNINGGSDQPTEPLLCKFADGGPKKNKQHQKFMSNGRSWRDGELQYAYDIPALSNGIQSNRMMIQPPTYPLPAPPMWVHPSPYVIQPHVNHNGVIPAVDPNFHQCGVLPQLAAQMNQLHLSQPPTVPYVGGALGAQYLSQYPHNQVPPPAVEAIVENGGEQTAVPPMTIAAEPATAAVQ